VSHIPSLRHPRNTLLVPALLAVAGLLAWAGSAEAKGRLQRQSILEGFVESDGAPLVNYRVSLYGSYARGRPFKTLLGSDITDGAGHFEIRYRVAPGRFHPDHPVFYVLAENGPAMLASAVGSLGKHDSVVVNELTTVAIGTAFAQFIDGRRIYGNTWGMRNAVSMAANMADPETGAPGMVISTVPNGPDTSTFRTFKTIANMVASCVASDLDCELLFDLTTPPGGEAPESVLQALANLTKYPAENVLELFALAGVGPYDPPLLSPPTSWLLFIKFTGGPYTEYAATNLMSGPGNVAFDERGFAWINDNYVPSDLDVAACAGLRLMKFYPWGESFPRSPYFGGGLSGAGFGITLDRFGLIWVGNFGFEAPVCTMLDDPANKVPATHDSVSLFRPDGVPISGFDGFTEGHMWWPQGTVSDRKGNIWVANCGNDTVTVIPRGNPSKARNIPLPGGQGEQGVFQVELPNRPLIKPFGVAIDPLGRAWVTGNHAGHVANTDTPAGRVYRIEPNGSVEMLPHTDGTSSESILSWPMGISGDSHGNMWVSNSDSVNVPCVTPLDPQDGAGPSLAFYPADGGPPVQYAPPGMPEKSGGITIPWGNAVDGADTLWVFNFGQKPTKDVDEMTTWPDTPLSRFCGADTSKCPGDLATGDPISPPTGYVTDALDRVTGGGIDPSGNVWLLNNWKKTGPFPPVYDANPGGNSFVIVPGAAAPVKTPLIGPPRTFRHEPAPQHGSALEGRMATP